MTEPEPYDSTFDLGGLPGGDALFTDPTSTSYSEPAPTAPVLPPGGTVYRADPPTRARSTPTPATTPTPPARWPRPGDPVPDLPGQRGGAVPPASPMPRPAPAGSPYTRGRPVRPAPPPGARGRRRGRRRAWPLIILLFWGGQAMIRAVSHGGSSSGSSSAVSAPADGGVLINTGDMTVLRPHSINANSTLVTIHIDAPASGSHYTITDNGVPVATSITSAFDHPLTGTQEADEIIVAASDEGATIRCEIRDATGQVVATGEATGTLDCAYDPSELLE